MVGNKIEGRGCQESQSEIPSPHFKRETTKRRPGTGYKQERDEQEEGEEGEGEIVILQVVHSTERSRGFQPASSRVSCTAPTKINLAESLAGIIYINTCVAEESKKKRKKKHTRTHISFCCCC